MRITCMKRMIKNKYIIGTILLFLVLQFNNMAFAGEKGKFNAGEMIVEHISDSYEWHIITVGETHVSIPLPVILIYNGELKTFCSSNFNHGTTSYEDFKISEEAAHKGKIVHITKDATGKEIEDENLPYDFSITKNVMSLFLYYCCS